MIALVTMLDVAIRMLADASDDSGEIRTKNGGMESDKRDDEFANRCLLAHIRFADGSNQRRDVFCESADDHHPNGFQVFQ